MEPGVLPPVTIRPDNKTILGPALEDVAGRVVSAAAPRLGEHNAYVFGDILGLSDEEQQGWQMRELRARFRAGPVVAAAPDMRKM